MPSVEEVPVIQPTETHYPVKVKGQVVYTPETAIQACHRILETFEKQWNTHNMNCEEFKDLFTDDCTFINPLGQVWKGKDEIAGHHQTLHDSFFRHCNLYPEEPELRILSPTLALARSHWRAVGGYSFQDGITPGPDRQGYILFTLEFRERGWIIIDSQNTEVAPVPPGFLDPKILTEV